MKALQDSRATLFRNVNIIDGSGDAPRTGNVVVKGDRIESVAYGDALPSAEEATSIEGSGLTLMPGLCDAHAHLSWIDAPNFEAMGILPVEEHMLATARNATTYLDCGYTMAVGAAAAKPRLDVAVRNAINSGLLPGPRYLANGPEIGASGGYVDGNPSHLPPHSYAVIADGVDQMRLAARKLLKEGVDLLKIGLSGEALTPHHPAPQTVYSEEEVRAAVSEAGKRGVRVCVHARNAESVKLGARAGAHIFYHASWLDEEALDLLEARRHDVFVAPALSFPIRLCEGGGEPWGLTGAIGRSLYEEELHAAVESMRKLRKRGIRVLPGGDYGFAWTPHGTYAKDLEYFVEWLGFTAMEAIEAATRHGGEIMQRSTELGRIEPGFLADLLLVEGDPSEDIRLLQDPARIKAVMKGGIFHKSPGGAGH